MTHKLFEEIGPRYADRPGGYTRILKLGTAPGRQRADGADRVRLGVEQPAGAVPSSRWRLLIAYDGAAFRGFAVQPEVPSVAGALRQALERTARMGEPPHITCAGRTDAGVHALGQVVHVDLPAIPFDGPGLGPWPCNRQLAPDVVVRRADPVGPGLRRPPLGHRPRRYRYLVVERPGSRPAAGRVCLARARPPRPAAPCATASDVLLGDARLPGLLPPAPGTGPRRADRPPGDQGALERRRGARGHRRPAAQGDGRLLRFEIEAGSFCHQMVRSLVASLVAVGRGRENAAGLMEHLRAATRHRMADPAPAHGLCLVSVAYEGLEAGAEDGPAARTGPA